MTLGNDIERLVSLCKQSMSGPLAVLYGGWSAEREVSLMSGNAVIAAFEKVGLPVVAIDIERNVADVLGEQGIRHVFNALHGPYGEDGVIGGLLQFLNISATGSGVLASALAMDKLRSKQLWRGIGVNTPSFAMASEGMDYAQVLRKLGGKVMVKPAHEGSSIGMSIAESAEQLVAAIDEAQRFDSSVLIEQFIEGPEYSVPVIAGNVLPITELKPKSTFYDYEAKYFSSETEYECPAQLSDTQCKQANQVVMQAYESLGCRGWGRVDLLLDDNGNFQVLEVNTIPGMTEHSIVPMSALAAGLNFESLVLNVLLDSLIDSSGAIDD
ncbi:MAG: D-alanine--D-alanine ligase [Pseudomonadales bacterium]